MNYHKKHSLDSKFRNLTKTCASQRSRRSFSHSHRPREHLRHDTRSKSSKAQFKIHLQSFASRAKSSANDDNLSRPVDQHEGHSSKNLSDLLMRFSFPHNHHSPTDLFEKHDDVHRRFIQPLQGHPSSLFNFALCSLLLLHDVNQQCKVLEMLANSDIVQAVVKEHQPISTTSSDSSSQTTSTQEKKHLNSSTLFSSVQFHSPQDSIHLHSSSRAPISSTTFHSFIDQTGHYSHLLAQIQRLLYHTLTKCLPHILPAVIDSVDKVYYDHHLKSIAQFGLEPNAMAVFDEDYTALTRTLHHIMTSVQQKPSSNKNKLTQPRSSLVNRRTKMFQATSQQYNSLAVLLSSISIPYGSGDHQLSTASPAGSRNTRSLLVIEQMVAELKHFVQQKSSQVPLQSPSTSMTSTSVPLPHIGIGLARSSSRNLVACFSSTYGVLKSSSLASHTKNTTLQPTKQRSTKPSTKSRRVGSVVGPTAVVLKKPKKKVQKRQLTNGFVEQAILPPLIAPHHQVVQQFETLLPESKNPVSLSKMYSSVVSQQFGASLKSRPHISSLELPLLDPPKRPSSFKIGDDPFRSRGTPQSVSSQYEHEIHRLNNIFFKTYPSQAQNMLTFEAKTIELLFHLRPVFEPRLYYALSEAISMPIVQNVDTGSHKISNFDHILDISALLHANRSEADSLASNSQFQMDPSLFELPALLTKTHYLLNSVLSTFSRDQIAAVETIFRHSLPVQTPNDEMQLLLHAFSSTFKHHPSASSSSVASRQKSQGTDNKPPSTTTQPTSAHFFSQLASSLTPTQHHQLMTFFRNSESAHVQGIPLVSMFHGLTTIAQHELLHSALLLHAPYLWTNILAKPLQIKSKTQRRVVSQKQRQTLDMLHRRYLHAQEHFPSISNDIYYNTTQHLPQNQSNHQSVWFGNSLPSLLKSTSPNEFWPKNTSHETVLNWKSPKRHRHISGLPFVLPRPAIEQSAQYTVLSSIQDGHSPPFRQLARNLFGHNKINVHLPSASTK